MSNLEGQTFAGYDIISQLGRGGMGSVFKARQPKLDRLAALKIMASELANDPDFVARFRREAAAAANLSHPNIVQVYSAGESEGTHYIAMEFVDGETVKQHIESQGRLDPREAIAITVFVAEALQYAWNKARLIHRDIKPDNIFLSKSGEVKVGDLGLAKTVGGATTNLTQTGMMMGSPHYISPEQARGVSDIDFRTDIYSLGCTLYHMLTGRPPYEGPDPLSVITKHVNDPPPAIFKSWPGCPVPLALVLGKMLAKRPHERPASYEDLIEQLREVHDKLKPIVAAVPAAASGLAKATPTPKPVVPKVATSRPATAVKPKGGSRGLLYAVAGVAAIAAIAGAVWWFANPKIETKVLDLDNGVTMTLSVIPPGTFLLGSTKEERQWVASSSKSQNWPEFEGRESRKAEIKQPFWIGQTEVTVAQWRQFANARRYLTEAEKKGTTPASTEPQKMMGPAGTFDWQNPKAGFTPTDTQAATWLTWNDAVAFCKWLDGRERDAGRLPAGWVVRLPTEAEWEYACRAGTQTKFWWGDAEEDGKGRLNIAGDDDGFNFIAPVDSFGPQGRNRFGLADMLGNAREWCLDEFDDDGAHGEMWVGNQGQHVQKGGCAFRGLTTDRCAFREKCRRNYRAACTGFRIAVGPEPIAEYEAFIAPRGGPGARKGTAVQQPRQTVHLLGITDPVKDRIKVERGASQSKANAWERRGGALVYVSDGGSGKLAPPVAINARSYEIEVDFERLSGPGRFHVDLPLGGNRIIPLNFDSKNKMINCRAGNPWPANRGPRAHVLVRLDRSPDDTQDRIQIRLDGELVVDWQGDAATVSQTGEPHPDFPGQPVTSIYIHKDSYEVRVWQLRIFDGEATMLREPAATGPATSAVPVEAKPAAGLQYGLYYHFDISTFSNSKDQSLNGKLPLSTYAPKALDVRQWVRVAREAGATFAVLSAKYEAGFLLWPAKDHDYHVGLTPVKTNVLQEFVGACKAEGITAGVQYSVPDAHVEGRVNRNGPVSAEYFQTIKKHLAELAANYPDILIYKLYFAERLSPAQLSDLTDFLKQSNPNRIILQTARGPQNRPGIQEHNVATVNEGWIWLPNCKLTPVPKLLQKYQESVQQNRPLLLNVGPDRDGRIPDEFVTVLTTLKGMMGIPAQPAPSPSAANAGWQNAINLLPLIDPAQDATSGRWETVPDGLKATDIKSMSQKIQPPYRPPEEYDYRVSFTPVSGNADVAIGLTAKGRSFVFYMKKFRDDHCLGFEAISGKNIAGGPTAHRFPHLEMGSRYTVVIEVRKNGLRGYLDGKLVAEWATDYSDMTAWPVWKFKDDTLPGFGCSVSTVVFQEARLREISGKGTFTRGMPSAPSKP